MDVPVVEPGPGEVRIRVAAAAVNPVDLGVAGARRFHAMGLINQPERTGLGWDFAGTVEATGPGADLVVGTRVAMSGFDRDYGTYAEQLVVPASDLAVVPDGLDLVTASTAPLNGLAAAQIVDLLGDAPADGNRLLVTGVAGAVGGYVAVLEDRGRQVTGLARAEDEMFVRSLGADFTTHAGVGMGCRRRRSGAAETGPRPRPRRRDLRRRLAERRAGHRARDHRRRRPHTPTPPDWSICSRVPRPASCRFVCTWSCRWTKSPTPIEPWRTAGCADATCSSRDRIYSTHRWPKSSGARTSSSSVSFERSRRMATFGCCDRWRTTSGGQEDGRPRRLARADGLRRERRANRTHEAAHHPGAAAVHGVPRSYGVCPDRRVAIRVRRTPDRRARAHRARVVLATRLSGRIQPGPAPPRRVHDARRPPRSSGDRQLGRGAVTPA